MKIKQYKILKLSSLFLLLLFVAQSCVVSSLNPLYTDGDRVHLDELDGVWISEDNEYFKVVTIVDSLENEKVVVNSNDKFGEEKADVGENDHVSRHTSKSKEEEFFEGRKKNSGKSKDEMDKKERYFFNPQLRKHYQISIATEKDTCVLDGRLSKLDGHYFIDVIPNEKQLEKRLEKYVLGLTVRTHGFFKLDFNDNEIKVNAIEYDDFEDLIKKKKIRIEHEDRDGEIIITAKTPDIQKFLIKFANTKMFNDPKEVLILKRAEK